jgi:hypothetical protein
LRYFVNTRDYECKIYKAKNDRTNDAVSVWNGPGFSGNKEHFKVGWYDIRQLRTIGNDRMTGMDVPAQFKVTLYQHHRAMGKKETFYGPYENLAVPKWQRTVSGIRVEPNENFVTEKEKSAYKKYKNYCVNKQNRDIHQTRWTAGAASLDKCQRECDLKAMCGGIEWYESGWNGSKCHLLLTGWGGNKASKGKIGGQWQDAECYVREDMKEGACKAWTKYTNYCVNSAGRDIPQTRWTKGAASLEKCQQECKNNSKCSGVEWYESGWNRSKCHLLLTGHGNNRAAGGQTKGRRW